MEMNAQTVARYSQGGTNAVLIANGGPSKSFIEEYVERIDDPSVYTSVLDGVKSGCSMDSILIETDFATGNPKLDINNPLSYKTKMGGFIIDDILEHSWLFTLNDKFEQNTRMRVPVNIRFNTTSRHSLPSYTSMLHNAMLYRDFGEGAYAKVANHPFRSHLGRPTLIASTSPTPLHYFC